MCRFVTATAETASLITACGFVICLFGVLEFVAVPFVRLTFIKNSSGAQVLNRSHPSEFSRTICH